MVGAVLALAAASASAQSFEDILRGVATDALRGVLKNAPAPAEPARESLPADPAPMVIGNTISADQALALVHEVYRPSPGFSIHESPFESYWLYGSASQDNLPILVSKDGRWIAEVGTVVIERLQRGKRRDLPANEAQEFFRGVLLALKPDATIDLNPAARSSAIILTAPNCPACVRLDLMSRTVGNPSARLVPASLTGNSGEVYSRIMCDAAPRQAFERAIDSRARALPPAVSGCDKRLNQRAIAELLWAVAQPGGGRRAYPSLFTADGQKRPLQFDSPAALRQSLAQAGF